MSRSNKAIILLVIVVANLAILWWRYEYQKPEIKGVGPFIAALGVEQADTVRGWRNAASVPLTPEAIGQFADRMKWGGCAAVPSQATVISPEEMSSKRHKSLSRMVAGLIEVYSQPDAGRLYDYMTGIDEELSPASVVTLQQLLITDGAMSPTMVKARDPRELFVMIGQKIRYGSHWSALVSDSACVTAWRTDLTPDRVGDEVPLGGPMVRLFKNQTRFHQLFQTTAKPRDVSAAHAVFADVQFAVKHDRTLMSEPSAYHIRLVLDPAAEIWYPVEMVHVATISGQSPPILF